ncbi:WecB/TagA/CpsF family glycosyltransferase [Occallatibacter riparius]|uniref:WecB/TagA/CpsF family glycosyltransferase n=1 Tax=Occallatibacter riparius TaxID=1002689 RepID=A0A9J7BT98_9BACT|nr:WecB/TagA/CpsF family glycosyltransferase [Occallatibacter riparius]UWZ86123.1 WecB/TagA/CpsF family glycosyltransferase [Occallatibacter riparius]
MGNATIEVAIEKPVHPKAELFGLPISLAKIDYVLAEMDRAIMAGETGHFISETNTESMYHGKRIESHGKFLRECDFSLCDGVGVVTAGLMWGYRVPRVNGPILVLEACDKGRRNNWRHFFYGGGEGIADEMARRLKLKYPGLNVVGTYCPPFRPLTPEEDEEIVKMINDAKPDIVWVGLGLLKQERWIAAHLGRIKTSWMAGEGGVFDYHSGNIPWAPAPLRALGLEWLFRLIVQPKLRYKRYWWSLVWAVQAILAGLFTLQFLRSKNK